MFDKFARWLLHTFREDFHGLTQKIEALRTERDCADQKLALDLGTLHRKLADLQTNFSAELERATGVLDGQHKITAQKMKLNADRVSADYEDLKDFVSANSFAFKNYLLKEIEVRYNTLVQDAAGAARILDSKKVAMVICDYCHLPSRRFSVSRVDGKIICADCVVKGKV